jgi:hypothetical protein
MTEVEDFYAALTKEQNAIFLVWRGDRPMRPARWLKSVDLAVASPQ